MTAYKVLASAFRLKQYDGTADEKLKVYISKSLNKTEQEQERKILKKRRSLIKENTDPSRWKIRNLDLLLDGAVVDLKECWLALSYETDQFTDYSILTFNTRSLVNSSRLVSLSNFVFTNNFDIICLSKTWLTINISDSELFLPGFKIFRYDRNTKQNGKTAHGGVLIATKSAIKCYEISLPDQFQGYCTAIIWESSEDTLLSTTCYFLLLTANIIWSPSIFVS